MALLKRLGLLVLLGILTACASTPPGDQDQDKAELTLYQEAQEALNDESYLVAVDKLQTLEARYPFGRFAEQAQLELIYAYYQSLEPQAARAAAERFIRLHPQHENVDYAYYMKGLAAFTSDVSPLAQFLPLDPTQRDPGAARDAFNDFAQLLSRFPDSEYVPDAKARMLYLRNLLAQYELHVARYYMKREAYVAVVNRASYVVENFPTTPAVPDALALMAEGYLLLEQNKLAQDTIKVLKKNHPEHPNFDADGQFQIRNAPSRKSWFDMITFELFD